MTRTGRYVRGLGRARRIRVEHFPGCRGLTLSCRARTVLLSAVSTLVSSCQAPNATTIHSLEPTRGNSTLSALSFDSLSVRLVSLFLSPLSFT